MPVSSWKCAKFPAIRPGTWYLFGASTSRRWCSAATCYSRAASAGPIFPTAISSGWRRAFATAVHAARRNHRAFRPRAGDDSWARKGHEPVCRGRLRHRSQAQSVAPLTFVWRTELPSSGVSRTAGNSRMKRLPRSTSLSTRMRPPCSFRIFWLTGRPSPVPRDPLPETNNGKIFAFRRAECREPLSATIDLHQLLTGEIDRRYFHAGFAAAFAGVDGVGHHVQHGAVDSFGVEYARSACFRRAANAATTFNSPARDCISSTISRDDLVQVPGDRSGSRSLLNVSMSITSVGNLFWFRSTIFQPLRIMFSSCSVRPISIR